MNRMLIREIGSAALEHLWLVLISMAIAFAVAAPSAVLLTRRPGMRRITLAIAGVLQTIPSLALFGFLLPLPLIGGVGKPAAITALVVYALLPMLRNMVVGLMGVDPAVRESALAMGMTNRDILWQVEVPLAFPTILAGVRIAAIATIGTATIAAAIGGGGLGTFVFRGISMADTPTILAGAVPAALMAIVADEVLGWFERRLQF